MAFIAMLSSALLVSAPTSITHDAPHYSVGLNVAPDRKEIAVDAILALTPAAAGTETEFLLGRSYTISSATAGDAATVAVEPTDRPWPRLQRITVCFKKAEAAPRVRLRYAGPLNPTGDPPINMISPRLVELNLDSMWLPIGADLGTRFTADARIAGLPPNAVVVAQGQVSSSGNEVRIRRSEPDIDLAFVASPALERSGNDGFELYAENLQSERARLYSEHGAKALRFLEDWLGPMPGKPARIAVVTRPRVSGYSRTGYLVLTQGAKASEAGAAKFTAHEFAHAWLSNANPSSEHRWLDESTAEYVSLRYVEEVLGKEAAEELIAPKREMAADADPVLGTRRSDAELYAKGPLLLFELEERIGRSKMDSLLAEAARHRIGTTEGFLALLRERTDPTTASWFEDQLRT